MQTIKIIMITLLLGGSIAKASSGVGLNVGLGIPFVTQVGLNYKISDMFGLSATYNSLDLSVGTAKTKLTMPEILFSIHPFSGSYFIGAGLGQEKLDVSATSGTNTASAVVEATTTVIKTGWMWGLDDKGFWFGLDFSYIIPSNHKTTITAPGVPTNSTAYTDVEDAAKKFGETTYGNITFARLGWMF